MMSIKSNIMKIGVCSVMVLVPLSQTSLPSFAAEEIALKESQDVVNIPSTIKERTKFVSESSGKCWYYRSANGDV